ncbi:hypothetical protein FLAN108750_01795 [Flavobacterium antarcticum]|uniref:hypothetical protein n=1 Tax=Flavobacterium antarcticum TaxID=271155 RepID=UPI0003B61009|nr:hypothetical protein [Flavobacterium antarcticum]
MEKSNSKSAQPVNEGFSGKNFVEKENTSTADLKKEFEKDDHGKVIQVDRARYVEKNLEDSKSAPKVDYPTESIHQTPETAEHKDFNSNPNPDEFPDKNKKNQENRGNIKDS